MNNNLITTDPMYGLVKIKKKNAPANAVIKNVVDAVNIYRNVAK